MRVELEVDLRPTKPQPAPKPVVDPEVAAEKRHQVREERLLRRIALAQAIEARIAAGEFKDFAAAARLCGVSKARLSKAVDWQT